MLEDRCDGRPPAELQVSHDGKENHGDSGHGVRGGRKAEEAARTIGFANAPDALAQTRLEIPRSRNPWKRTEFPAEAVGLSLVLLLRRRRH